MLFVVCLCAECVLRGGKTCDEEGKERGMGPDRIPSRFISAVASADESPMHLRNTASVYTSLQGQCHSNVRVLLH